MYLSLGGHNVINNSYVDIDQIGSNDTSALLCHTNKTDCCNTTLSPNATALGSWYYSNDTVVGVSGDSNNSTAFFAVNRGDGVVRLFQNSSSSSNSEVGQFYCVIPDANNTDRTVYVNICELKSCIITCIIGIIITHTYSDIICSQHY